MRQALAILLACVSSVVMGQGPVFRAGADVATFHLIARDAGGRAVTDLTAADIRIEIDGRAVVPAALVRDAQPLAVTVLADTSMTARGLQIARRLPEFMRGFVASLQAVDTIRLGTFGAEIALGPFETSSERFERTVREEMWFGGGTPLWQAITEAAETSPAAAQCVLLLVTDGRDTGTLGRWAGGRGRAEAAVLTAGCTPYAIGLRSAMATVLADVAEAAGGGVLLVDDVAALTETFGHLAADLRARVLVGLDRRLLPEGAATLQVTPLREGISLAAPNRITPRLVQSAERPSSGSALRTVVDGALEGASIGVAFDVTVSVAAALGGGQAVREPSAASPAMWLWPSVRDGVLPVRSLTEAVVVTTVGRRLLTESLPVASPDRWRRLLDEASDDVWGRSAIWDGVKQTAVALPVGLATPVVVLVTDGFATGNAVGHTALVRDLAASGVTVHVVWVPLTFRAAGRGVRLTDSTKNPWLHLDSLLGLSGMGPEETALRALVTATGGRFLVARSPGELTAHLATVVTQARAPQPHGHSVRGTEGNGFDRTPE